jgi:SsrA-binding protein
MNMKFKPIENKKAHFDFEPLSDYVAGMALRAPDVKAILSGSFSLVGAYVKVIGEEVFLLTAQSKESIKLLLTRREIKYLIGKTQERGLTIVPTKIISHNRKFKLEMMLARGKKEFDKRQTDKARDADLEARRVVKSQKLF